MFNGRRAERAQLDRLLETVRSGHSAVLVLRGEAGIGKSVLLGYVAERGEDCRVLRAAGVESERELPFAALHQLCSPLLGGLERLPSPQRDALATAFGLSSGTPPDRFIVGLAVLGLLSDVAHEPVLCLIDDAHWLDRVSVRFSHSSRVACRPSRSACSSRPAPRARRTPLQVCPSSDSRDCRTSMRWSCSHRRHQDDLTIESPSASSPRHGGTRSHCWSCPARRRPPSARRRLRVAGRPALAGTDRGSFRQRIDLLPAETRRLLQVAAADPVGDPVLLWRAAARLGLHAGPPTGRSGRSAPAGRRVRFRHPLVRSAVYGRQRRTIDGMSTARWPTRPIPMSTRIAARGTAPRPQPSPTRMSLRSSSARRIEPRPAGAWRRRPLPRACSMLTPDPPDGSVGRCPPRRPSRQPAPPEPHPSCWQSPRQVRSTSFQRALTERLRAQLAFVERRGTMRRPPAPRREATRAARPRTRARNAPRITVAALSIGGRDAIVQAARALAAAPRSTPPDAVELLMTGQALLITAGYSAHASRCARALDDVRGGEHSPTRRSSEVSRWRASPRSPLWDDESLGLRAPTRLHPARPRRGRAHRMLPGALEMHGGRSTCMPGRVLTAEAHAERGSRARDGHGQRAGPRQPAPARRLVQSSRSWRLPAHRRRPRRRDRQG